MLFTNDRICCRKDAHIHKLINMVSAVRNVQRLVANLRWICPSRKMRDGSNVKVDFEQQSPLIKEISCQGVDGDESLGLLQQQLPACGG